MDSYEYSKHDPYGNDPALPDEPDDPDDDDTCPMCGEDAVESTRVPMGGGMTETWLICQMCGHVIEDDE